MQIDKFFGMIWGAFYADAYSLGAHWIYDVDEIVAKLPCTEVCCDPISVYHPTKRKGDFTHYGDQMLWLLEHVAQYKMFSLVDFGLEWQTKMSKYDGYIDKASKHTLQELDQSKNFFTSGSSSSDLGAVSRMIPLVLCYRNSIQEMQEAIKLHTILTHMNKDLVHAGAYFSEVMISVANGMDLLDSLKHSSLHYGENIQKWYQLAYDARNLNPKDAVSSLGQACSVGAALPSAIYFLIRYYDDIFEALKQNMLAGGDSAARGIIIGAILGLIHYRMLNNSEIVSQINQKEQIFRLISQVVA